MSEKLNIKQLLEKLKKVVIEPKQKILFDDMEDETGLNIGECMTFAQLGEAPTPPLSKKKKEKKNESTDIIEREVTPDEMLEEVEETFDPYEVLTTIVKNNREIIKVSVSYDNPEQPALMHIIKCEFLDIDEETVIDETIEEDLTIEDCLLQLNDIFRTHSSNYIEEALNQPLVHPRYKADYNYTIQEYDEGDRVNTENGNGTIEQIGTIGNTGKYFYGVRLDNGERLDCYGWELLPENFLDIAKKLDRLVEYVNDSGKKGILESVANWIDRLNFKNVWSDKGFRYMYDKGNYQHFIYFNNGNLVIRYRIYQNDTLKIMYDHSWYVDSIEKVDDTFKLISKVFDSYE